MSNNIRQKLKPIFEWFAFKFNPNYGRQYVGEDNFGNKFYLFPVRGLSTMRRGVEYATDPPELDKIHLVWDRWLHNIRPDTPTSEDLVKYEQHIERMKVKIKEVEEKDRLMKIEEERILRETGKPAMPTADMGLEAFIVRLEQDLKTQQDSDIEPSVGENNTAQDDPTTANGQSSSSEVVK